MSDRQHLPPDDGGRKPVAPPPKPSDARSVASERLERCRSREGNRVRAELLDALSRVPKDSLIFTRSEVDAIADALGGYTKLAEVLDGPR